MNPLTFLGVSQLFDMRDKPDECKEVFLFTNLMPNHFYLLAIGLDESSNALVFDEATSANLEEFKNVLNLYSTTYQTPVWMYRDELLENELRGCQIRTVESRSKPDTLAIIIDSLLSKKKIQIKSSLILKRKLKGFRGQNPTPEISALYCAVEKLQGKLNGIPSDRKLLVSIIPRTYTSWYRH